MLFVFLAGEEEGEEKKAVYLMMAMLYKGNAEECFSHIYVEHQVTISNKLKIYMCIIFKFRKVQNALSIIFSFGYSLLLIGILIGIAFFFSHAFDLCKQLPAVIHVMLLVYTTCMDGGEPR